MPHRDIQRLGVNPIHCQPTPYPANCRPILPTAALSTPNRSPILPTAALSCQPTPYPANRRPILKVVSRHREVSGKDLRCRIGISNGLVTANRRPIHSQPTPYPLPTDTLSCQPLPYPANRMPTDALSCPILKVVSRHREVSGKDLRCRIGISNGLV
jgi:DNA-binding Xre family transcriptional regulator